MRKGLSVGILMGLFLLANLPVCADTFTNKGTGEVVKGKFMGAATKDGQKVYCVKADDGQMRQLPESDWERRPDTPAEGTGAGEKPAAGGASVSVDFGGAKAAKPLVMDVVAEGMGTDPEKAMQNAFSNAIKHAVGELVDAETLVKNDDLVRDQILTFSRGYVEDFKVLKTWQEDGLHHANIRATVAREKLIEKLKAEKIAIKPVPGELMERQAREELVNEENAAEMFRKTMEQFTWTNLVKVDIDGKPEVAQKDATHAKVQVRVNLSPNMENWSKFRAQLVPLLEKIASKRCTVRLAAGGDVESALFYTNLSSSREDKENLVNRLKGEGIRLYLLKKMAKDGQTCDWDVFLVPKSLKDVLEGLKDKTARAKLRVNLLDSNDTLVAGCEFPRSEDDRRWFGWGKWEKDLGGLMIAIFNVGFTEDLSGYFVAPFRCKEHFKPTSALPQLVDVELDKLPNVTKCAAYFEEVNK